MRARLKWQLVVIVVINVIDCWKSWSDLSFCQSYFLLHLLSRVVPQPFLRLFSDAGFQLAL